MNSRQQEILEAEKSERIHVDTKLIQPHTKEFLASATLDFIRDLLNCPDVSEALAKKKVELNLQ